MSQVRAHGDVLRPTLCVRLQRMGYPSIGEQVKRMTTARGGE